MGNTIIVYFSLDGNVAFLAEKIAEKLSCKTHRLETVKEYPKAGLAKYFHGGKDASFGAKPELKNNLTDISDYSHIIIGTPVWAGKPCAPLNTFFDKIDFQNKDVSIFTSCSGGSSDKCVTILKKIIAKRNGKFNAQVSFVNPLRNESSAAYLIENFCKKIMG
ncbi:MAG: NAD(P)H-dependent oxidoreductase [Treponema sp.]|nr:NAD(P)H-dependent oxidoreductase [Treponema sp.]